MDKMSVKIVFTCLLILSIVLWSGSEAKAQCDQFQIGKINDYLSQFSNLTTQFVQRSKNSSSTGTFFMKRPGLMKLIYDRPNIEFIYKSGKVLMYDRELDEFRRQKIYNFVLRAILEGTIQNSNLTCKSIEETNEYIVIDLSAKYVTAHKTNLEISFGKEENGNLFLHSIKNLDDKSKIAFTKLNYNYLSDTIFTITR